jgi:cell division protein FtsZ
MKWAHPRTEYDPVIWIVGIGETGHRALEQMATLPLYGVEYFRVSDRREDPHGASGHSGPAAEGAGDVAGERPRAGPVCGTGELAAQVQTADLLYLVADADDGPAVLEDTLALARAAREASVLTVAAVTISASAPGAPVPMAVDQVALTAELDSLFLLHPAPGEDRARQLLGAIQAVVDLLTEPAFVQFDFSDFRLLTANQGLGAMGVGVAGGIDAARRAAEPALASPCLRDGALTRAYGHIVNVTAGLGFSMEDYFVASNELAKAPAEQTLIASSVVLKADFGDTVRVSLLATGVAPRRGAVDLA